MNLELEKYIERFRGDVQWIITISYLLIVAVGMLFTHKKYSKFGIDIFEYADVFDFLIAPFSDIRIVWFSILTLIIIWLILRIDVYWKAKSPKLYSKLFFGIDKKSWFRGFRVLSFLALLIFYLNVSATIYGQIFKRDLETKRPISVQFFDDSTINGVLIGKTKEVLFLLQNETINVIPIASTVKKYNIE